MHLEVKIFPIEGGKWGVGAYLIDENGLTVDAATLEELTTPMTWAEVFTRVDGLLREAEWRGFPVRMRDEHELMLRKTKGE